MTDFLLWLGALAGAALTVVGAAFRYGPKDNSDAAALASFVSGPFLWVGIALLVLCILGLLR